MEVIEVTVITLHNLCRSNTNPVPISNTKAEISSHGKHDMGLLQKVFTAPFTYLAALWDYIEGSGLVIPWLRLHFISVSSQASIAGKSNRESESIGTLYEMEGGARDPHREEDSFIPNHSHIE